MALKQSIGREQLGVIHAEAHMYATHCDPTIGAPGIVYEDLAFRVAEHKIIILTIMGSDEVHTVSSEKTVRPVEFVPLAEDDIIIRGRGGVVSGWERQFSARSGQDVEHTEDLAKTVLVEGKFCNETRHTTSKDSLGGHRRMRTRARARANINPKMVINARAAVCVHAGQPEPVAPEWEPGGAATARAHHEENHQGGVEHWAHGAPEVIVRIVTIVMKGEGKGLGAGQGRRGQHPTVSAAVALRPKVHEVSGAEQGVPAAAYQA